MSDSTVKRWVNRGEIHAARTAGGHRLISLDEAIRFATAKGFPTDALVRLLPSTASGPAPSPAPRIVPGTAAQAPSRVADQSSALHPAPAPEVWGRVSGGTVDELYRMLLAGRAREARELLQAQYQARPDAVELVERFLDPVMAHVGEEWCNGLIGVDQEHQVSQILAGILSEMIQVVQARQPRQARPRPLAIGASPSGDLYSLSGLACQFALNELGWDVLNYGSNLPLDYLANAVRRESPRLVWLTVSHIENPGEFAAGLAELIDHVDRRNAALIIGGRGVTPALRAACPRVRFGETLADLVNFARELWPAADPAAAGEPARLPASPPNTDTRPRGVL